MSQADAVQHNDSGGAGGPPQDALYWRSDGYLVRAVPLHAVFFLARNAQGFSGRWIRIALTLLLVLPAALVSMVSPRFGLRLLYTALRGMSLDRLDLLGEEYFEYSVKPYLRPQGIRALKDAIRERGGDRVVLVGCGLEQIERPLARHLGIDAVLANRPDRRDGYSTGRLCAPVVPPRRWWVRALSGAVDGRISRDKLTALLRCAGDPGLVDSAILPARRVYKPLVRPHVFFDASPRVSRLSVRETLRGKHILLAGVTGFIGKVWFAHLLSDLPDVGRIYLLIRRNRMKSAVQRFERIMSESPVFGPLRERHGDAFERFVADKVEIIEGDICQPGLGIDPETARRLSSRIDLVVNSTGLTDFNPDLRDALSVNVDGVINVVDFLRQCKHAALLHLSTCFVAGKRDGRIAEELIANYTPRGVADYDAERQRLALHERIEKVEVTSESRYMTRIFRREAVAKSPQGKSLSEAALAKQVYKNRSRWVRRRLTERGVRLAKVLGWPNTYCMTKSMGESQIILRGGDLPIAVVRPAIVESAWRTPFPGWNEGVTTSAPLSHLVETYFRQLPSRKRKCLDVIAVDIVCRGMSLVAAALVNRCHHRLYHLASSGVNPCDMRRSIELTGLAHRKHHRSQSGFSKRWRSRFDTIPVSKTRYIALSAPGQRLLVRVARRVLPPTKTNMRSLAKVEKGLDKLQKLIELYEPFILYNEQVFVTDHARLLSAALPPDELEAFGFDIEQVDWWDYWINVHVPGLRRWVFPLIEGRPLESRATHPFRLPVAQGAGSSDVQALSPRPSLGSVPPCPSS